MYTTVYLGKLSNSPKWPKPQPSIPSLAKPKRKMLGWGGVSLEAQWSRIHLSMQEAWVQSLI